MKLIQYNLITKSPENYTFPVFRKEILVHKRSPSVKIFHQKVRYVNFSAPNRGK